VSEGLPLPRRYYAILAVSFGTALVVIDGAIPTVALPTIARDLGVDNSSAVLVPPATERGRPLRRAVNSKKLSVPVFFLRVRTH